MDPIIVIANVWVEAKSERVPPTMHKSWHPKQCLKILSRSCSKNHLLNSLSAQAKCSPPSCITSGRCTKEEAWTIIVNANVWAGAKSHQLYHNSGRPKRRSKIPSRSWRSSFSKNHLLISSSALEDAAKWRHFAASGPFTCDVCQLLPFLTPPSPFA